jgi:hypothetical protein
MGCKRGTEIHWRCAQVQGSDAVQLQFLSIEKGIFWKRALHTMQVAVRDTESNRDF